MTLIIPVPPRRRPIRIAPGVRESVIAYHTSQRDTGRMRPVAPQVRHSYYLGALWRVSTAVAPAIKVTAWQGTSGFTGMTRRSWYRSDMYLIWNHR